MKEQHAISEINQIDGMSSGPLGHYISVIREEADLSQAQLAQQVTFSTATLSRIESGDKAVSSEELSAILKAIGTTKAEEFRLFLEQNWDELPRPPFDLPNRSALWEANLSLRKLKILRQDKDLKAIFLRQVDLYEKELRRIADYLASPEHNIAAIGSIGVGKSTGICKITGLLKPTEDKLDKQIVLETGAGGITLCEVHISRGPRYGLRIVPRSENSIRQDVEDFCAYLMSSINQSETGKQVADAEEGDLLGISKEVVRAIRNMADIAEKRKEEKGRRIRIDPAKELAKELGNSKELCIRILTKMDLLRRNRLDEWYPENDPRSPAEWLQELFSKVNNGRHPDFTLPQKIEIIVPEPLFENKDLAIRIIDTKGIDQTAERQDLECHFDDPRTLVVLCSRFNDAPEVAIQNLLRRAKDAGTRDIALKTVLLVLARPDEALAVKHDDGLPVEDDVEGYELKRDQIQLRLSQCGFSDFSVEFYNAREEEPDQIRKRLVEKIMANRQHYAAQISRLIETIERLEQNRENEQTRLVFEHVMRDLRSWLKNNENLEIGEQSVQGPLISAISGTPYASRIRAAVTRYGDWYNLDYYHHLARGVRILAVKHIGSTIEDLKVIIDNLITNQELIAAEGFLQSLITRTEAAVDKIYLRIQLAGREAFKQTLAKDDEFWNNCDDRWGQGPGYRDAIRDMTDKEFEQENLLADQSMIIGMIEAEWNDLVKLVSTLLEETPLAAQVLAG